MVDGALAVGGVLQNVASAFSEDTGADGNDDHYS
jgi:hypothetical protein